MHSIYPPRGMLDHLHRVTVSVGFFRTFTLLGWSCWLLAFAAGGYFSWTMARLCVRWVAG